MYTADSRLSVRGLSDLRINQASFYSFIVWKYRKFKLVL